MKVTRLWRILAVARRYRLRELLRGDITADAAA